MSWTYEDGLLASDAPVVVPALRAVVEAWFVVEQQRAETHEPSPQQRAAWDRFSAVDPDTLVRTLEQAAKVSDMHWSHLVVPSQSHAPVRFISLHFSAVDGTGREREYEAVFIDERLLFTDDDHGTWASLH